MGCPCQADGLLQCRPLRGAERTPVSHASGTTSDDRAAKEKSSAGGRCHLGPTSMPAAMVAGPARRGSLLERCAAQRSTAKRDLDMSLSRGEVDVSDNRNLYITLPTRFVSYLT
jgi:hypothetical protein